MNFLLVTFKVTIEVLIHEFSAANSRIPVHELGLLEILVHVQVISSSSYLINMITLINKLKTIKLQRQSVITR